MKSVNIRNLKHETSELMERVATGESLEITRRNKPIAVIKPIENKKKAKARPRFKERLQTIYGERVFSKTATQLLAEERGER